MRYTLDQSLPVVLRRADAVKRRRDRAQTGLLSGATLATAAALLAVTTSVIPLCGADLEETAYGAFLLPSAAGSYVLVGVAAFVLGVLVTLLCLRARKSGERPAARLPEQEALEKSDRDPEKEKPEEAQHTDS